ncbi:hypothetical protein CAEBREN_24428 [Caenorhabditis brenneri]|uniref:T20D4.11-like domain-containing protein n=1 Tax=Caenorhabditis brenneri TaxID=135651 RepID=G0MA01_CAEBE|nr:hypothetical protein CAEBREN_24428 [Caenorhabditis brenneri]
MTDWLKLVGFGVVVLSMVYTSNVTTTVLEPGAEAGEMVIAKNCTPLTFFRIFSCMFRVGDFMTKLYFLNVESKSSLQNFHHSCTSLQECLASLACGKQDPKDIEMVNKIGSYCSGLHYMFEDFQPCMDKFEEKNKDSKCFKTWSPFVEKEKNGTARTQKEICDNYFGEKNCMAKEIGETCGKEAWKGLRDHFIKITPDVHSCDFGRL